MAAGVADIPPSALEPRLRQFVENAQAALRQGNFDYVLALGEPLLREAPDCVAVRRVMRAAQLQKYRTQNAVLSRMLNAITAPLLAVSARKRSPMERFVRWEKLLARHPANVSALKLQAQAAGDLGWIETVVFLREAVRELTPADWANALALGEAWLALGRSDEALGVAEAMLRARPVDGAAQALLRKASIAQAMSKGNWEGTGDYREKLREKGPM